MTRTCAAISEADAASALAVAREAIARGAECLEFRFDRMPILPDAGIFGSDDIVALDQAVLDVTAKTPLIEENVPMSMEVHTRKGHPLQWLHGPYKDPYKVVEYGAQLGLGSQEYELLDVLPVENLRPAPMGYISAQGN